MQYDLLVRNVCIEDGKPHVDIAVKDGKIVAIEQKVNGDATTVIDGKGHVVVPGLVESHIHLDKAFVADRKPNLSGTLQEALKVTADLKPTFTPEDIKERSIRVLELAIQYGVTHMRTHSEFDPVQGFTGFDIVMDLKKQYAGQIDLQVVAFPQEGIIKAPGTLEMMEEALEKGADVVGGIPYNDSDADKHIDIVFELAKKYRKPVDFHLDFRDDAEGLSTEYICQKTIAEGFEGLVSGGHVTGLGALPHEQLKPLAALMAKAQINIMSLPQTDLHLGGRRDEYNVRRALTPIRYLRDAGVNMSIATNNIRNAFTPYGNGDLIQTAILAMSTGHLGGASDLSSLLQMITENPAKAMQLEGYGLQVGCHADFVILSSTEVADAIIDIPERLFVVKSGKLVAKTEKIVTRY